MTEPTGERFLPEFWGTWALGAEHHARYRLAAQLAAGRTVLDAGCGVGWGAALLLDAGARSATGIDISSEAIADARAREPRASFAVGDLRALPLSDRRFDLITCFEAIEHVEDPQRALDELARMLAPGGVLLVSSPNPRVYPPGNPYHVREFAPEELYGELAARFSSVSLWLQFGFFASVLIEGGSWPAGAEIPMMGRSVVEEPAGQDPYSVAIATNDDQPTLTGVAMFAPAEQISYLALPRGLVRPDGDLAEEHRAMMLEIDAVHRERAHAQALLLDAEQRAAALDAELATMRSSRSWRATASLRYITGALRRR